MGNTPTSGDESNCIIMVTVLSLWEVRERLFNEYEAGGSIHTDGAEATLVYMDRGVRPLQCDRTGGPSQGGSIYPTTLVYLVSCPDRTLYAREGLVHQVHILGSVPQNEEHPIRSLKDYVITFLSILYRFGLGSGNDIHSD